MTVAAGDARGITRRGPRGLRGRFHPGGHRTDCYHHFAKWARTSPFNDGNRHAAKFERSRHPITYTAYRMFNSVLQEKQAHCKNANGSRPRVLRSIFRRRT